MEDADAFGEHKVHEVELTLDEVLRMVPRLVDIAVAWEGCDVGERARELDALGVDLWASEGNLALFKAVMPAPSYSTSSHRSRTQVSSEGKTWPQELGGSGIGEMFTERLDAFFARAHPAFGATCTLSHGDLPGDNIFFCDPSPEFPYGWLCIDFQLMFRGPVPSDLAYLMNSGTVLPEVYTGDNLELVLRTFYDAFVATKYA